MDLLAATDVTRTVYELYAWLGGLLGMLLVLAIVLVVWKKRYAAEASPSDRRRVPFTLDEIRALHREGELNDAEYEELRQQILRDTRGASGVEPPRAAPPAEPSAASPPAEPGTGAVPAEEAVAPSPVAEAVPLPEVTPDSQAGEQNPGDRRDGPGDSARISA